MGKNSGIAWTDHTWNPWRGCTRCSPACEHCYMFREQERWSLSPDKVVRQSSAVWKAPERWNLQAQCDGTRPKVFTCSWSDFFHADADAWRAEAWAVIRRTTQLTWLVLTKRIERAAACLPEDWGNGYPNVWLGVTAWDQESAYRNILKLGILPAAKRFLSVEPMLGPLNLTHMCLDFNGLTGYAEGGCFYIEDVEVCAPLDWVICGAENGPKRRPMDIEWARSLRDQCARHDVPFFYKGAGGTGSHNDFLDGVQHHEFPA